MNIPPYGDNFRKVGSFFSTIKAEAYPVPSMQLQISAGGFWVRGKKYIEFKDGSSPVFEAPTVDSKFDLLVVNTEGKFQIVKGIQSRDPVLPECLDGCFPICFVYLDRLTHVITSDRIFDVRGVFHTSKYEHSEIHGIDDITDLRFTLDAMPTDDDLRTALRDKADVDGTPATTFTFNRDHVGTPTTDVILEVKRGSKPNVFIRWNEDAEFWEYTNDGNSIVRLTSIGPSVVFPPATTVAIGGIIVGSNLSIENDGRLSAVIQSDENYTLIEKNKLATIEQGANRYVHPNTHPASLITQEYGLRFFSDDERLKLAGISDMANYYQHPVTHDPSIILQNPNNRFITDVERYKLNGIEEGANKYIHPSTHSAEMIDEDEYHQFMTTSEKIKLATVADNANNYVHPALHPANMITTDEVHRFVTDIQISDWNNKATLIDIDNKIDELIGVAPDALNTLSEIGIALNNDPDFATTITNQLSSKVDKIAGKMLSTNDFTTDLLNKLNGIEALANNYIHPTTHPASIITEDTSRRFVTDLEKTKLENIPNNILDVLNNKVDKVAGMGLSSNDFTSTLLSKLIGIEASANNYTHPTSHPASMILEDDIHRFVRDVDKVAWNAKDQYVASVPTQWSASAPTTVGDAINRLVAAVYTLRGNIPV